MIAGLEALSNQVPVGDIDTGDFYVYEKDLYLALPVGNQEPMKDWNVSKHAYQTMDQQLVDEVTIVLPERHNINEPRNVTAAPRPVAHQEA